MTFRKRSNLLYLLGIEIRAVQILVYTIAFPVFVYHLSFRYFWRRVWTE